MGNAAPGLQSEVDVNSVPTVGGMNAGKPATWSWIWFFVALLVIVGFHIKLFGRAIPPSANFPSGG